MRTSKTIKDPTFNIYRRAGSVEKAMESIAKTLDKR